VPPSGGGHALQLLLVCGPTLSAGGQQYATAQFIGYVQLFPGVHSSLKRSGLQRSPSPVVQPMPP